MLRRITTAMWCRLKCKLKAIMGPTNREMILNHLSVFMWAQRFNEHLFFHLRIQITTTYPTSIRMQKFKVN